jgi:hypothetical protein
MSHIRDRDWNRDPLWAEYVESLEPVLTRIVTKMTQDLDLREDCKQVARIALHQIQPSQLSAYDDWMAGKISDRAWSGWLSRYCRNVIRNRMATHLRGWKTGPWNVGRVGEPTRYSSLDTLLETGAQVDHNGTMIGTARRETALLHGVPSANEGLDAE